MSLNIHLQRENVDHEHISSYGCVQTPTVETIKILGEGVSERYGLEPCLSRYKDYISSQKWPKESITENLQRLEEWIQNMEKNTKGEFCWYLS